jgi:predicted dehydrogenase
VQYQGGFLLDGGVHYAAGIRMVLGVPIERVSSFGRLNKEHLAPIDTVHATLHLADGI